MLEQQGGGNAVVVLDANAERNLTPWQHIAMRAWVEEFGRDTFKVAVRLNHRRAKIMRLKRRVQARTVEGVMRATDGTGAAQGVMNDEMARRQDVVEAKRV